MSTGSAFALPPINAGDVFTCQGNGLLYEDISRIPIDELRRLLSSGSGQIITGNRKEYVHIRSRPTNPPTLTPPHRSKKWFQAQCAHYGLPTKGVVATLRSNLDTFLASPSAQVPPELAQLEVEKNDEYKALNEKIKSITSRARSPTPGRTRRVTLSNELGVGSQAPGSQLTAPRLRTASAAERPRERTENIEPEEEPLPVKRGRGRPRKSEPAPAVYRRDSSATSTERVQPVQNGKGKGKKKEELLVASGGPVHPGLPSQADSTVSGYSELDDRLIEDLDEIEKGIDMLETDPDGDSQMNPPPSPPRIQASLPPPPQTPKRPQHVSTITPSGRSPKSTLERDVVSGMWTLRIVANTDPVPTSPRRSSVIGLGGSMNLHLAEDKRSLVGEFSLLGMDGVVQSRTLEGRVDGAYARLSFVGQTTIQNLKGKGKGPETEGANRVYGPSSSQSGYLRFTDGRKDASGRYTLKGALQGAGFGKVDFEGVKEGEEQELCVFWDDFVD